MRPVISPDSLNVHQVWPVPAEGVELDTVAGIAARVRAGAVRLEKRGGVRRRIHEYRGDGPVRGNVVAGGDVEIPPPIPPPAEGEGLGLCCGRGARPPPAGPAP